MNSTNYTRKCISIYFIAPHELYMVFRGRREDVCRQTMDYPTDEYCAELHGDSDAAQRRLAYWVTPSWHSDGHEAVILRNMTKPVGILSMLRYDDRTAILNILQNYNVDRNQEECVLELIDSVLQDGPSHSLKQMQSIHMERNNYLSTRGGDFNHEWNIAEWTNALQGEAGEAGNIAKKICRGDYGEPGSLPHSQALSELADELADVLAYTQLICGVFSLSLDYHVIRKFQITSDRFGYEGTMMGWGHDDRQGE